MRDTDSDSATMPSILPLQMRQLHFLAAQDIAPALDDAQLDSLRLGEQVASMNQQAAISWEPVSLGELISFHRQLFIWRTLRDRPRVLYQEAVLLKEAELWQGVRSGDMPVRN